MYQLPQDKPIVPRASVVGLMKDPAIVKVCQMYGCSPHQARVILKIKTPRSFSEIAWELGLSLKTVKFHMTRIYRLLGVKGRPQAILKLAKDGL